jgi:hypothetical protein
MPQIQKLTLAVPDLVQRWNDLMSSWDLQHASCCQQPCVPGSCVVNKTKASMACHSAGDYQESSCAVIALAIVVSIGKKKQWLHIVSAKYRPACASLTMSTACENALDTTSGKFDMQQASHFATAKVQKR